MNTLVDHSKVYENPDDFFQLGGHAIMKLTPQAAIEVCRLCTEKGIVVGRIEGGIWHHPGFEARLDSIWDGEDYTTDPDVIRENNLRAIENIEEEMQIHDAFIITIMKKPFSEID